MSSDAQRLSPSANSPPHRLHTSRLTREMSNRKLERLIFRVCTWLGQTVTDGLETMARLDSSSKQGNITLAAHRTISARLHVLHHRTDMLSALRLPPKVHNPKLIKTKKTRARQSQPASRKPCTAIPRCDGPGPVPTFGATFGLPDSTKRLYSTEALGLSGKPQGATPVPEHFLRESFRHLDLSWSFGAHKKRSGWPPCEKKITRKSGRRGGAAL